MDERNMYAVTRNPISWSRAEKALSEGADTNVIPRHGTCHQADIERNDSS
jgi:hypothetical protein